VSLPSHIEADLARYERGELTDSEALRFYADVLVAGLPLAMPPDVISAIGECLMDGALTEAGDILRWPGE
jgi:hypothetical protein